MVIAVAGVATVVSMLTVFRGNEGEGLLAERWKPPIQEGQPLADKIILLVFIATFVGVVVFIALDVFQLHLTARPTPVVSAFGLALFVAGWWIESLAMKANAFAAPVVKYQGERGQIVIDTGVYGLVRHPMYAGAIPLLVGMALWLESYAAALLALVPLATLVVRLLIEERFLRCELKGYEAYMQRVPYRLIPRLW